MSDNNFFIRELSLLEFNKRVVLQASDKSVPILERLKYLCIADSNLDEFFEIKVAFIRKKLKHSRNVRNADTNGGRGNVEEKKLN